MRQGRGRQSFHTYAVLSHRLRAVPRKGAWRKCCLIFQESGFAGPIRPDRAPTLDGQASHKPGYAMGGKVPALEFMNGAMDAMGTAAQRPGSAKANRTDPAEMAMYCFPSTAYDIGELRMCSPVA